MLRKLEINMKEPGLFEIYGLWVFSLWRDVMSDLNETESEKRN